MKLIQTIHRASGHSAKVFEDQEGIIKYKVQYYLSGKRLENCTYYTCALQDAIDTAQLELMILQDQDLE